MQIHVIPMGDWNPVVTLRCDEIIREYPTGSGSPIVIVLKRNGEHLASVWARDAYIEHANFYQEENAS